MDNYEFCAHFVERLHPDARKVKALDYGCGRATTVALLRSRGFEAFGCDVFYGGASWRSDVPPDYLAAGVVRDMPDGRIPFDDETFEVVVSNQVFEHVPDLGAVLAEISRVLRPGGVLLFLFPDRSIWREGHYGLPFLHWFPRESKLRTWYAGACRALGFGYNKDRKPIWQWSRDACRWIDEWTYYRTYKDLQKIFARGFIEFQHHEAYWLTTRFGENNPLIRRAPKSLQIAVVRKWAGMVGTCRKPTATPSPDRLRIVLADAQN
jgi:SAM-dependent methyltransferase